MAIIVFSYRSHPDADLWYHASGCETLDNGYISAFEGGNPGFYEKFMPELASLLPVSS